MISDEKIISQLESLGMNDVTEEFKKISGYGKPIVPTFYAKKTKTHQNFRNLLYSVQQKAFYISEDERKLLEKNINPDSRDIDVLSIDFTGLKQSFPSEKQRILADDIITTFTDQDKKFNGIKYHEFIDWYNNLLNVLEKINSIEEIDSCQCISSSCLQQFIIEKVKEFSTVYPNTTDPEWTKNIYSTYVLNRILFDLQLNPYQRISVPLLVKSKAFSEFIELDKYDTCSVSHKEVSMIYDHFTKVAEPQTLTIKKEKMKEIYSFRFNDLFIDKLYEHIETRNNEATFLGFIQFYIPLRFISEYPHAINFFFKILDADDDGILGRDDIYYYYKAQMAESLHTKIFFDLFYSRLLDICTLKVDDMNSANIENSGYSRDIVNTLIDVETFENTYSVPTAFGMDFDEDEEYEEEEKMDF
ncbi:hypothetical protein TVAG_402550 [Trichomonas vaginalis G3]|uniref:EF-hand domain-containing protein n=1 Tax=Trichomonas vaginalis (strain ATCC PRA-98 / G3) TaxID=412133 RepID=A2DI10_TRIV3|nr:Serine/threonine-protein phosphatase 2A regulatory subunit B'' subunit gamma family [Trichomonas vaginalis G3]EAY19999.1 hypothetical protein TVAG_402550 [Trichomonas vaginalis G3]KAI5525950.1 Serine/threonine-protein phosphatase 2A regulatory subunit B'' subunit gamma family [Trichomonas vaginalis G3]|eukprot:XP_001580985.1 hypothetical protein [Trichomonas vaginalis G3]